MSLIRPIQYLRGVAAMLVVAYHAAGQIEGTSRYYQFEFGPSGVDLFFVISGFIMVVTTKNADPIEFMRRRIVRVVPLYWLLTLTMIAIAILAPSLFKTLRFSSETVLQSLLFIPHYSLSFPRFVWPVLVPGWTLNFEMFFYAVFAASMCLRAAWRLAGLTLVLVSLIAMGYAFGPFESPLLQTYTSPRLVEFVGGAVLGRFWTLGWLNLPTWVSFGVIVVGATSIVARDHPPLLEFNQISGAILIVTGSLNKRFSHWRNLTLQAIGDASYSIYLTHIFTLGALRIIWQKFATVPADMPSAWSFLLLSLITCAWVGWLTFRWIEQPLLHNLNRFRSVNKKLG